METLNAPLRGTVDDAKAKAEAKRERAKRIRSYIEDSGLSRREATAFVDFEDGK